ncbi:MAG: hypothetical protein AAFV01_00795 [Bacteroidota bacterium]
MPAHAIEVRDVDTLIDLVEQGRVDVRWSVTSEGGPGWIGSARVVSFLVDGTPVAETALVQRLATALVEALSIPASSQDHVISGEGTVRKRDRLIEVEYEWDKAKPYAWPSETGGGTVTLIALENR